jgi:hypothetical protein
VLRALQMAQFSDGGQGELLGLAARAEELRVRILTPAESAR